MNQRSAFARPRDVKPEKSRGQHAEEERGDDSDEYHSRRSSSTSYGRYSRESGPQQQPRSGGIFYRRPPSDRGGRQGRYGNKTPDTSPTGRGTETSRGGDDSYAKSNKQSYSGSNYRDYVHRRSHYVVSTRIYDDTKFVNFLCRLQRDEDRERRGSMIHQLHEIFTQPENTKVVISNLDEVITTFDVLLQVMYYADHKKEISSSLGMLGSVLGVQAKRILEWMFRLYNSSKSDEIRIVILKSLLKMLNYNKEKKTLSDVMPYMMTNVQSALEVADVPNLLIAIVNVIYEISIDYPEIFSGHFSDTVDILIGWHIDMTQQLYVIEFTSRALINFQQFWIFDMNFTLTLLGQFLEDMESYAESFPKVTQSPKKPNSPSKELYKMEDAETYSTTPSENIAKIHSLVRVLTTVLKSIGNVILPDDQGPITWNFLIEMTKNFLSCILMTFDYFYMFDHFSIDLVTSANDCLCQFLVQLQSHSLDVLQLLVAYVNFLQSQDHRFLCERHVLSVLRLMTYIVKAIDTRLPVEFVTGIFDEAFLSRQLRFSPSTKVQRCLLALHHSILNVKNVSAVEEFYNCIMRDILSSYAILSASEDNAKDGSFESAQITLLSSLSSLVEIGNAKHSIIRMWALKPGFFELLSSNLQPALQQLAVNSPATQYAILVTLHSHCQRHNHFVGNSSLLQCALSRHHSLNSSSGRDSPASPSMETPQNRNSDSPYSIYENRQKLLNHSQSTSSGKSSPVPVIVTPQNSENLASVFVLLANLLSASQTSYDSKLLAVRWTLEIFEKVEKQLPKLVGNPIVKELVNGVIETAYVDASSVISKTCARILRELFCEAGSALLESIYESCFELCILKLNSHDTAIQEEYVSLLALLPIDIILSGCPVNAMKHRSSSKKASVSSEKPTFCSQDVWFACHAHMSRPFYGSLPDQHFKIITSFVLQGLKPQNDEWLLNLFYSCPPYVDPNKPDRVVENALSPVAEKSSAALWFWATWEVAQLCVMCKLRTPLGKPQETFMAIEGALKACAKSTKQDSVEKEEFDLFRIKLLLSLMEHLEKLMYNAYEGCCYALSSCPKIVRTFFRTNKATCQEWLSRVRLTTCVVAINAGQPAVALRHGYELLAEMKSAGKTEASEFETVLFCVVRSLIDLRCPEAVLGLYVWCRESVGHKFTWIKAAVDHAAGRFEAAAHEYSCVLQSAKNSPSPSKLNRTLNDQMMLMMNKNGTASLDAPESEHLVRALCQLNLKGSGVASFQADLDARHYAFLINQTVDCYVKLGSWEEVSNWISNQDKIKLCQNGATPRGKGLDGFSHLKTLSNFENMVTCGVDSLPSGLDESHVQELFEVTSDWEVQEQVWNVQKSFLQLVTSQKCHSFVNASDPLSKIRQAKDTVLQLMKVTAVDWPPYVEPGHGSLLATSSCLESLYDDGQKMRSMLLNEDVKLDPANYCCSSLTSALSWTYVQLCLKSRDKLPKNETLIDLMLVTTRLARKQQNLKLAQKLVLMLNRSEALLADRVDAIPEKYTTGALHQVDASLLRRVLDESLDLGLTIRVVKMQREGAKLLQTSGETESAYGFLLDSCIAVASKINQNEKNSLKATKALKELNARSLLNVVKYIQLENKPTVDVFDNAGNSGFGSAVTKAVAEMETLTKNSLDANSNGFPLNGYLNHESIVGETNFLVGRLLLLSVQQCPSLSKSWCAFASWCYRWGWKVIDSVSGSCMNLLPEEDKRITSLLPNVPKEDRDAVLKIVTGLHCSSGNEWDNHDADHTESGAEETRQQLLTCCMFLQKMDRHEDVVEELVDVWKRASSRTYYYYKVAAQAYLQYLQLDRQVDAKGRNEDDNVTATLRLLRLVVKHASELRDVLEDGLAQTPTAPWRGIIPQLFSRLNHPELYVRRSISDLLCRVAQASPHLIVFPAVVGSLTLKVGPEIPKETSSLFGACFAESPEDLPNSDVDNGRTEGSQKALSELLLDDEEPEEEQDQQKTAIMQNCFAALVETLGRQDGRTIAEVKALVHELHRITLLWDELWLGTLSLHHPELSRRITNLEKEIVKVLNNTHLTKDEKKEIVKEKHNVYVMPTIFVLEQLQMITNQNAETPHEQWFQKTFSKDIDTAIEKLRHPHDPSQTQDTWVVYRKLHQLFQQKLRQTRAPFRMEEISPKLAATRDTVIPMPGIRKREGAGIVTIASVCETVSLLPTKTKPKKLAFIGSDGRRYGYLFKGLEDLHLDERIMQFLSIVNNMFAKSRRHGREIYNARHYSVTPLGPRSGLIQWVDGAIPLFSLYKKWQQREVTASTLKGQTTTNAGAVLRPSEIYYNKLTPLLKEAGVANLENRKEWPLDILVDVLKELMDETPKDLLAKELWCHSTSALEWWNITQTYNHSTAVMSVIGYVIGLGDRHLDNVLVDLTTGEVVHIDYNVCFEKGKNLRVPERVPFRMTPNIRTAFGVTGIEGIFRVSCEHVLKVLRKGRETLLTLLEAFVYDPLVDWTPGSEGGYTGAMYGGRQVWANDTRQTRQDMETDIAWSMFSIRVAEMKGEWLQNRDDLLAALPKLELSLDEWEGARIQLQSTEQQLQEQSLEKALLEDAQGNPSSHHLFTLPKRYDEITIVKNAIKVVQESVREKLSEYKKWQSLHSEYLSAVCGPQLSKWRLEATTPPFSDSLSVGPVIEFLQSAGQGQLVQQDEHLETELNHLLQQQRMAMAGCVDLLSTYATMVKQFGPSFQTYGRNYKWEHWLEELLCDFSVSKCQEILSEFHSNFSIENISMASIKAAVEINFRLQEEIGEVNKKLRSMYERQLIEGIQDKNALIPFLEERTLSLLQYVSDGEVNQNKGHFSLLCICVNAFCAMYKRLMMLEKSAMVAADSLVDLMLWNGDWFLDEMWGTSSYVSELARLLLDSWPNLSQEAKSQFDGVHLAKCVFNSLEDMMLNFQNVILPEAVASSQEPSVVETLNKLDRIIARCGAPLDRLVSELESNARNIIMEQEVTDNLVNDIVKKLRNEFESLMKRAEVSDLSQGQMLLIGFNGLFTTVDSEMEAFLGFNDNHTFPVAWRKLDAFQDTVVLAPFIHNPITRSIVKDVHFLCKLMVIQQFFHLCQEYVAMLHCDKADKVFIHEQQLVKPVRVYIAKFVQNMMLGLPSQTVGHSICLLLGQLGFNLSAEMDLRDVGNGGKVSIEEVAKKAVDLGAASKRLQPAQLAVAGELAAAHEAAYRKFEAARRLEQNVILCKNSLQRSQLQLARFQWLNEDFLVLGNAGPLQNLALPARSSVMSEIRKAVQALPAYESASGAALERRLSLAASVEQRLKWAAGANPSLAAVQEEFEAAIRLRADAVADANQFSRDLVNVCNAILHFEALRTRTTEALSSDATFLALVTRCQESCLLAETCQSQVCAAEERFIQLQPLPENDGITSEWLKTVTGKVSRSLLHCQEELDQKKALTLACWESMCSSVSHLHGLLSVHHKLMSEVRQILRSLSKHEEQASDSAGGVQAYISLYKQFSERILSAVSSLLQQGRGGEESVGLERLREIRVQIPEMIASVSDVYAHLLTLGSRTCPTSSKGHGLALQKSPHHSLAPPRTPQRTLKSKKKQKAVARDPRTGKALQERNTYATNVWKRVKIKLDGRDPDPGRKSTVAEQVDFMIKEATHVENLAVLYEGWTPWV